MKRQFKRAKISIKSVLCVSILIIGISTFSNMSVNATIVSYDPPSYSSLIPHAPIGITFDSDFEVYLGAGTEEDPYVIEGYNITTTSTSGIYISDTTKHFIVRNCYVDAENYGIYIDKVTDGTATIENNTCSNNINYGIYIRDSNSSTIANNTCSYSGNGIYLYNSGNSTVSNNTCSYNNGRGIYLVFSSGSTVSNNTCSYNNSGIYVYGSSVSTVTNNTCSNNINYGIYLTNSASSSTVSNNTCNNNEYGISLSDSSGNSTVSNNTCSYNNNNGIYLYYSDSTVTNNTCIYNNDSGIYLVFSSGSTVSNNTCSNNGENGISLVGSDSSTVSNNTCIYNNDSGIYIGSSGSTISNNTCSNNNYYGIYLYYSDSTVSNNTCSYNNNNGIYLYYSDSSTVSNNTCNNNDWGIYLWRSDFCVATYNLLQENGEYGIYISSYSDNKLIHHNIFVANNLGGTSQGYDDGTNNTWYDNETLEGNHWSDWSGTGTYSIDGDAEAIDIYPLEPTVFLGPPVIANIIHSPSTPTELDTVSINATVTSLSGVQSVAIHYRVNGGTWIEASMTLIGGDLYSGTIGSFTASDTIEYYITAVDNSVNHNEAIENNNGEYYNIFVDSSDVIGPSITGIIHSPSTPTELDTVNINATVADASGVQSVTLHYRVNSGTWQTTSMVCTSGDLYSGIIGPFAASDTIEYYITAVDNSVNYNEAIENNNGEYYNIFVGSSDVIGPSITGIIHSPTPTELDTVDINATVADASGVQSVTLHYRVNGGTWVEVSMTLISGYLYSGTIGPFAASDTIEYYITAVDNSVNHNLAINDNSGENYLFTILSYEDETKIVTFSLLLPAITLLFLVFGLVVQQRRKK